MAIIGYAFPSFLFHFYDADPERRQAALRGRGRAARSTSRDRSFGRGTRSLAWPGTDAHGLRVRPGLYFARIEYEERAYLRRIVLIP